MSYFARHASSPARSDEQFPGSDEPTDRLPIVQVPQQRGAARLHRAAAGEVAALAFAVPLQIPAQRRPVQVEMRPAC